MMTMDERVEAVCASLDPQWPQTDPDIRAMARAFFGKVLAAAYPELQGDKPTHAIMPMEPTGEMVDAGAETMNPYASEPATAWTGFPTKTWKAMYDAFRFYGETRK